ncbi:FCD domain-containing protein [Micromonospora globispora]|uniref:FCD domain-containing protein n=1 Tax=Micromonospora globispora TaxID=1450148 RepID=UPI001A9C8C7C|nr:FCD domain-containing protein [Micromonospora globispora]
MSLPHALLGVLDARPMNGYALAQFFAGAQNWIWAAPQSQVYGALKKLESDGLIVGTEAEGQNGLTTTVYSLTPEGRTALVEWISTPHPPAPTRDAFGLQALHFDSIDPQAAIAVVDAYVAHQRKLVEEWSQHRDALAAMDTPLLRERLKDRDPAEHERIARLKTHVFDGQIAQAQARLDWALRAVELLGDDPHANRAGRAEAADGPTPGGAATGHRRTELPNERMSRAQAVAHLLSDLIVSKQVSPGERLGTKEELRQRYGVAVGTLNETIRLLETRGLIETRPGPGGGIFVAAQPAHIRLSHLILGLGADALSVVDTLEIRNALETPIALSAMRNARSRNIARLEKLVAAMGECADNPAEYLRRNWDLHQAIAELSTNRLLRTIYISLLGAAREAVREVVPDDEFRESWQRNLQSHIDLVAAIASGDPHRVVQAVEAHTPVSMSLSEPALAW